LAQTEAFAKWLFSRQSKRLLLEALLERPSRAWSRKELAKVCGQHEKARMDLHLEPLVASGIVHRTGDAYRLVEHHPLVECLRALLEQLRSPARR
jgi:hypothetical protein